jgi:hypothetical protein
MNLKRCEFASNLGYFARWWARRLGGIASEAWGRTVFAHLAASSSLLLTTPLFLTGPCEPRIDLMTIDRHGLRLPFKTPINQSFLKDRKDLVHQS